MKRTWKPRTTKYLTDLTDAQWRILQPFFRKKSKRGRPVVYDRRSIINAIFYPNHTGCQWRMLPADFPPWKTIYQIFSRWRNNGLWKRIHDALRIMVRKQAGKKPTPATGIIDSQSVKTTEVGSEQRGYDAGKKVNGRKRHLIVDTLGMVLGAVVHGADQQDNNGACLVLYSLWKEIETGQTDFRRLRLRTQRSACVRQRRLSALRSNWQSVLQECRASTCWKCWVVERKFAWMGCCRRHSKDYERNPESSETMIYIRMIYLLIKRLTRDDS